jgi:putative transcriptional regulator
MQLKPRTFIQATPSLNHTNFEQTIIFITEYDSNGATGFIINKLFHRQLNELHEFSGGIAFPLYEGGPVDNEHLYFLHQRPDLIQGGALIANDIYLGGDFAQAINSINNKSITAKDIKICIGYCGWDTNELETEIEEGSWTIVNDITNIFLPNFTL